MTLRSLHRDPLGTEGGGLTGQVAPAATPVAPSKPAPFTPSGPRKPTEVELKQEFKLEPMPGDPDFIKTFDVKQIETPPAKPAEPKKEPSSNLVAPAAPVEPEKKADAPIAPEKKVAEPPKVEQKTEDGPIMPPSKDTGGTKHFDYSGYSESEQMVLKNMSSQSREVVSRMMKEHKELSKLKDAEYLQNPNAYLLSPEYQKLQEDAFYANKEAMHWQEQIARIKAGQEWQPIVSWDAKGNPVLGEMQKPSGIDEERVRLAMNKCFTAASQVEQEARNLQQSFNARIQQDTVAIQQLQKKNFGWVNDPKLLDEKISTTAGVDKSLKEIKDEFLGVIPIYRRNTLEADVAANLFVALQIYAGEIRKLRAATQVAELKTEEVRRAEPSSTNRPQTNGAGKPVGGVKEFSMQGLPV